MRAGMIAVGATAVAVFFGGIGTAAAQGVETGLEHFQGRWVWNGALKAKTDPNNVSRIQFNGPNTVAYCYNKKCWKAVTKDGTGGSYAFSTDGRNRFEFSPLDGSRTMARFWGVYSPRSQEPDATALFTLKSGH